MNTSLCTWGTPGSRLPSSAISENPGTAVDVAVGVVVNTVWVVCEPTIEGTCMCNPALTMRTSTLPVAATVPVAVPCVTGNNELVA